MSIRPHCLFISVGLVSLLGAAFYSVLGQPAATDQAATWAYWTLLCGVLVAALSMLPLAGRLNRRALDLFEWGTSLVLVVLIVSSHYYSIRFQSTAERDFILDTYPNYLLQRIGEGDLLVSASADLRLGNLPKIASYLDLRTHQDGMVLWDDMLRTLQGKRRVFLLDTPSESKVTQESLQAFLQTNGCLDGISSTKPRVWEYELNRDRTLPGILPPSLVNRVANAFDPVRVDFGPVRITGVRVQGEACSHGAFAMAIRWQRAQPTPDPLKITLSLLDSRGRTIQSLDSYINDPSQQHTDQWKPDDEIPAYYLVPVPFGTAPGDYTVSAAVYPSEGLRRLRVQSAEGTVTSFMDHVILSPVRVYSPDDVLADPYQTKEEVGQLPANLEIADGLTLEAYQVSRPSVLPGQPLRVTLRLRARRDGLPSYRLQVRLQQDDRTLSQVAGAPADGTYPTDRWRANEAIVDRRDLVVPPEAMGGKARLEVAVEKNAWLYLADIQIPSIEHISNMPSSAQKVGVSFDSIGELAGYELSSAQVAPDKPIELNLYWRASGNVPKDYVVFAQLLTADNRLLAQSDSAPAQGQRPTRGWLPNEVIQDRHNLALTARGFEGEGKIIVGLYDPDTLERVSVQGNAQDHVVLPVTVSVGGP